MTPLSGVTGRMNCIGVQAKSTGRLSEPAVEQAAIARARTRLGEKYPHSGPEPVANAELSFSTKLPLGRRPISVIFGAGHDAAPIVQLAWTLGFRVTVVDLREAFLTPGTARRRSHWSVRTSVSSQSE